MGDVHLRHDRRPENGRPHARGADRRHQPAAAGSIPPVWGTFYDIRRYGGLQILLRALVGEGSMVLAEPGEPLRDQLARLARIGVTHLTGTPSHWRRC